MIAAAAIVIRNPLVARNRNSFMLKLYYEGFIKGYRDFWLKSCALMQPAILPMSVCLSVSRPFGLSSLPSALPSLIAQMSLQDFKPCRAETRTSQPLPPRGFRAHSIVLLFSGFVFCCSMSSLMVGTNLFPFSSVHHQEAA